MKQYIEALSTLTKCFEEMESLMAVISNRLCQNDIPVEALFVEYWPTFLSNHVMYKVWDGNKHLAPLDGKSVAPALVTAGNILEIVRYREILYRKF